MKSLNDLIWEERLRRARGIMKELEETEFKGKLKKYHAWVLGRSP